MFHRIFVSPKNTTVPEKQNLNPALEPSSPKLTPSFPKTVRDGHNCKVINKTNFILYVCASGYLFVWVQHEQKWREEKFLFAGSFRRKTATAAAATAGEAGKQVRNFPSLLPCSYDVKVFPVAAAVM